MRHDVIEAQLASADLGARHRRRIADSLARPDTRGTGRSRVASGGLGLRVHRKEKIFIGAATKGFDFLGYRFQPRRKLRASRESLRRLRVRTRRLDEQGADRRRLREYLLRGLDIHPRQATAATGGASMRLLATHVGGQGAGGGGRLPPTPPGKGSNHSKQQRFKNHTSRRERHERSSRTS